jgi:hypothetical protein
MSKKLFASARWKAHLKRRQEAQDARLRRGKRRFKPQTAVKVVPLSARRKYHTLSVPAKFSIIENCEEVVAFLNEVKLLSKKANLTLDLSGVSSLTTEAIAALIALMAEVKDYARIQGNQPENAEMRAKLVESGFFQHVVHAPNTAPIPSARKGMFLKERSTKVDPEIAKDIIHTGTEGLYGKAQKRQAAYRTLIESMNNTHNHAAAKGITGIKTWWCTVYADTKRKRICYAFVDLGVGIFKSVRISRFKRFYKKLTLDNGSILKDILEGKVESSTGIPYRGKGLPSIYRHAKSGRIKALVIVANDVYADVEKDKYITMRVSFGGTLLYWETD